MLLASLSVFAQSFPSQPDEANHAEIRAKIGLDMTVPDFETKKIDASVMGNRLAGTLEYLRENYQQGVYERRLVAIADEQNEALENVYIQNKKMKFLNAVKKGNEITILMRSGR